MKNTKALLAVTISVITMVLLAVSFVNAQYVTEQTTPVAVPTEGVTHVEQTSNETGAALVTYDISAAPGSNGSVTTAYYSGNPQPAANITSGVTLTNFVAVTFNMDPATFVQANITLHYTDSQLAGMTAPYAIYKYLPETDTFVMLPTIVDATAKTMTATVNSPTDPLFAIGNAEPATTPTPALTSTPAASASETPATTPAPVGTPTWAWITIVAVVVVVVLVLAFVMKKRQSH